VPNATLEVETEDEKLTAVPDGEGRFSIEIPVGAIVVRVTGKNIKFLFVIYAVSGSEIGLGPNP
jgi:hypothetical protein